MSIDKQILAIKNTFKSGSKELAISECQKLVYLHPKNTQLRKLFANLLSLSGKLTQAIQQLELGYEIDPNDEELLFNLAISKRHASIFKDAIFYFEIYTQKYPNRAEGWGSLSECQFQEKLYSPALASSERAIALNSKDVRLFFNRAKVYRSLEQLDQCVQDLKMVTELDPNHLSAWMETAEIKAIQLGKNQAISLYEKVTGLPPKDNLEFLYIGKAYYELGEFEKAMDIYQQLIAKNQLLEMSYLNLGAIYHLQREYPKALTCFNQVLLINPNSLEANINMAKSLQANEAYSKSQTFIDKSFEINPQSAQAYSLRANYYENQGLVTETLHDLLASEKLDPSTEYVKGNIIHKQLEICDWSEISHRIPELKNSLKSNSAIILPFQSLLFFDDPELQQLAASNFVNYHFPKNRFPKPIFSKQHKEKIKIAYLSPDFGTHPISYLTAELFELHDRKKFEVIGVSLSDRKMDPYRQRIMHSFDEWIDLSHLTDSQCIELLRSKKIDIAIDLCGLTTSNKIQLFIHRIAPLQISYLGYLGTLGTNYFFDYLIADPILIPPDKRKYYDEKIIYLPNYQINDRKKALGQLTESKLTFNIPEEHYVFACLNNNFKYQPEIFSIWLNLLKRVPQSSLILFGKSQEVIDHLINETSKYGIQPSRLVFWDGVNYSHYLARLNLIDLFLDTPIYNAGTTASDALWMGVPVLTCIGESFAARIAASLLIAIGLEELITHNLEDYEKLAILLATQTEQFNTIKNKLRDNKSSSKLFNSRQTTLYIEQSYHLIWQNYLSGNVPKDFIIEEKNEH